MRLSRSQRRTGTRRPQRGAVGRVRLYNVTNDAVVDGPQSGGAGWAEGRDPAAARPPRRRGAADPAWRVALDDEAFVVDARGRCTVGRARRGSRAPACGRWQGSIPVSDALWAQRLTPSPAPGRHVAPAGAGPRAPRVMVSFCDVGSAAVPREVLEAHIPGLAGIHPGIRRSADPTTDRGQSYMALSKPRTTEPGSRDDHADPGRHLAPGATHLPGAAPVTAEIA